MTTILCRPAVHTDIDALVRIFLETRAQSPYNEQLDAWLMAEEIRKYIDFWLYYYVAEVDGTVVGLIIRDFFFVVVCPFCMGQSTLCVAIGARSMSWKSTYW